MKVTTYTFLFGFIVSSLFGQIPDDAVSIEDTEYNNYFFNTAAPVIKGRILNLTKTEANSLKISCSIPTPLSQRQIKKTCELNPDGTFEFKLDYPFPYQHIWFVLEPFFYGGLCVNSELIMELDANKLRKRKVYMMGDGVKYMGADKALNSYFQKYRLYKVEKKRKIYRNLKGNNLSNGFDSIFAQLRAIDDAYINENPSVYSWLIKNDRLSEYYRKICLMHWGKELNDTLWEKIKKHKGYMTSSYGMSFYSYLLTYLKYFSDSYDFENFRNYSKLTTEQKAIIDTLVAIKEKNLNSPSPVWVKHAELANEAMGSFLSDTLLISNTQKCICFLDSIFISSKADMLKLKLKSKDPNQHAMILDLVMKNSQTEWCNKISNKEYGIYKSKLDYINNTLKETEVLIADNQLGTPLLKTSFGAELYKADNIDYLNLVSNIKNAFKGKALLLDFWATWCGPCLREMPISNKLHHEFKDAPVEFIYLCTSEGSDMEKWKSKIAELQISGTHLFVKNTAINELMNFFAVNGFPSYVFIDSTGKYIPGAGTRPSLIDKNAFKQLIGE